MSRRLPIPSYAIVTGLSVLSLGAIALGLGACSSSETKTTATTGSAKSGKKDSVLFVQTAPRATFKRDGSLVRLTLHDVSLITTAFTVSPQREVWKLPTTEFVGTFDRRFPDSKPNATVSSLDSGVGEFVMDLSNPKLTKDSKTLSYSADVISRSIDQLPNKTGAVSLFIDPDTVVPPLTISGTVKNGTGSAVQDALVEVGYTYKKCGVTDCDEASSVVASDKTGSDGHYSILNSFSWGTTYDIGVTATGYVSTNQTVKVGEDGAVKDFTLQKQN